VSTQDLFGDMGSADPVRATDAGGPAAQAELIPPMAERLRPRTIEDVEGQAHLTAPDAPIGRMLASGRAGSMILCGPPGTGKTTMARLVASTLGLRHVKLSAIGTGVADLKKVFADAQEHARTTGAPTVLFIDEIHRFNKAQQDGFLPHMEAGTIVLIGATTENPSFELNAALLSRAQVYMLEAHSPTSLAKVLDRAERENGRLPLTREAREALIANSAGDARYMLGQAETLLDHDGEDMDIPAMERLLSRRLARHDKSGDGHYDLASAFQKSVRGSDANAALLYAAKMIDGGEHPSFIFRRLVVMASEEVGMADPTALATVVAARAAFDMVGLPEAGYAISQAIIHVATAPKSNASYLAWGRAMEMAKQTRGVGPPKRILNAPTRLMKEQGRKAGYQYDHDHPGAFSGQDFWPDGMQPQTFYEPNPRGFEDKIRQRTEHWEAMRRERRGG
jgi:putative ATPase